MVVARTEKKKNNVDTGKKDSYCMDITGIKDNVEVI